LAIRLIRILPNVFIRKPVFTFVNNISGMQPKPETCQTFQYYNHDYNKIVSLVHITHVKKTAAKNEKMTYNLCAKFFDFCVGTFGRSAGSLCRMFGFILFVSCQIFSGLYFKYICMKEMASKSRDRVSLQNRIFCAVRFCSDRGLK
jgi:hypothetical protein